MEGTVIFIEDNSNLSLLKERVGVRIVPSREIDLVHKWGYKSLSSRVVQHCYCIYEGVSPLDIDQTVYLLGTIK